MANILCSFDEWFAYQPHSFRRQYLKPRRRRVLRAQMLAARQCTA